MNYVEYCADGDAISDFEVNDWLNAVTSSSYPSGSTYKVSTSAPIHKLRLAIADGEIACDQVTFVFRGKKFQANRFGAIQNWPSGFADIDCDIAELILRSAMARKKREKKLGNFSE